VVYSACGLSFFGTNDPEHFGTCIIYKTKKVANINNAIGTMAMSMWTFFQLATMDVSVAIYSVPCHVTSFMLSFLCRTGAILCTLICMDATPFPQIMS
jgi:hypothetical protein